MTGKSIVNQSLMSLADTSTHRVDRFGYSARHVLKDEARMQRLRLKADGRIVELRDGQEFPLVPVLAVAPPPTMPMSTIEEGALPAVRDLRRRAQLTQLEFASRLGVPVETIRNWEQGKRMPRGPARALLAVIAHAPDTVFSALAKS